MVYDYLFSNVPNEDSGSILYTEEFSAESWCKVLTSVYERMMDEECEDSNYTPPHQIDQASI